MKKTTTWITILAVFVLAACQTQPTPKPHYKVGKPYVINGTAYYPAHDPAYDKVGIASWYGPGFHGKYTANGEVFNQDDLTAAHPTLPMPSLVRVTHMENGKSLIVRVNDRGPFKRNRIIDLSRASAQRLGIHSLAQVRVQFLPRETEQYLLGMAPGSISMAQINDEAERAQELASRPAEPETTQVVETTINTTRSGQLISNAAPVLTVNSAEIAQPEPAAPPPLAIVETTVTTETVVASAPPVVAPSLFDPVMARESPLIKTAAAEEAPPPAIEEEKMAEVRMEEPHYPGNSKETAAEEVSPLATEEEKVAEIRMEEPHYPSGSSEAIAEEVPPPVVEETFPTETKEVIIVERAPYPGQDPKVSVVAASSPLLFTANESQEEAAPPAIEEEEVAEVRLYEPQRYPGSTTMADVPPIQFSETELSPSARGPQPTTEELTEQPQPIMSGERYVIQAGSFATENNARKLTTKLSSFTDATTNKVTKGEKTWWLVRVGPFSDITMADEMLAQVREAGVPDARIVRQ